MWKKIFANALSSPILSKTDEAISGEALIALQHSDLKEMGMSSVGHRLKVLKAVYDIKTKQSISIEADHYVPLCKQVSRFYCHFVKFSLVANYL